MEKILRDSDAYKELEEELKALEEEINKTEESNDNN